MMRHLTQAAWALGLGLSLGLGALTAQSQTFPTKPVRLVIPFAPGGSTDASARIIQDKLSTLWGQPLVIDTKPATPCC